MKLKTGALCAIALGLSLTAQAITINYNATNTAIYGGGNSDLYWSTAASDDGNVLAGLRSGERYANNFGIRDGAGDYAFALGTDAGLHFTAQSAALLAAYNWVFMMDINPAVGVEQYVPYTFSLALFGDNSYGNALTANGAGVEGNASLKGSNYKMQNSIPFSVFGINPNIAGEYSTVLFATPIGDPANPVTRIETTTTFGSPTSVPDTGSTLGLMMLGLLGMVGLRQKLGFA